MVALSKGRVTLPKPRKKLQRYPEAELILALMQGQVSDRLYAILAAELSLHMRPCPQCGVPFLSRRANHQYCTVKCENRVAVEKYRQQNPATRAAQTDAIIAAWQEGVNT